MQEEIIQFKEFVKLFYDIDLTPQQLVLAEFIFENPTICVSGFSRRSGQKFVLNAIREMEKQQ